MCDTVYVTGVDKLVLSGSACSNKTCTQPCMLANITAVTAVTCSCKHTWNRMHISVEAEGTGAVKWGCLQFLHSPSHCQCMSCVLGMCFCEITCAAPPVFCMCIHGIICCDCPCVAILLGIMMTCRIARFALHMCLKLVCLFMTACRVMSRPVVTAAAR